MITPRRTVLCGVLLSAFILIAPATALSAAERTSAQASFKGFMMRTVPHSSFIRKHSAHVSKNNNSNGRFIRQENRYKTISSFMKSVGLVRGGGKTPSKAVSTCNVPTKTMLKIVLGTVFEWSAMMGLFAGSLQFSSQNAIARFLSKLVGGLPIAVWTALIGNVFASSAYSSILEDAVLNSASNQLLDTSKVPGDESWFDSLTKPWWNPPQWVFPVMWVIISKPTQVAAFRSLLLSSFQQDKVLSSHVWMLIGLLNAHICLGNTWNRVFFGLQCVRRATLVISVFYGLLLTSTVLFGNVNAWAGIYLLPTCAWAGVATSLSWFIYLNN